MKSTTKSYILDSQESCKNHVKDIHIMSYAENLKEVGRGHQYI